MTRVPVHGCQHVDTMIFEDRRANCSRCGASWVRDVEGPWRIVDHGRDPDREFVRCSVCGALTELER